jgi:membrane protease YdiL (CAAX protease family)
MDHLVKHRYHLADRPLLGVLVVLAMFWAATLWGSVFSGEIVFLLKFISLGFLALVLIPFVFGLPFGRVSFYQYTSGIYLKISEGLGRQVLLGVVSGLLLLISLFAANALVGQAEVAWQQIDTNQVWDGFIHGLWEEVLFRGVVLVLCLRRSGSRITGLILAAVIFAGLHLNLFHLLRLFCMGMLWGVMTLEAKSLLPAVISHTIYDVFFAGFPPQVAGSQVFRWLFLWQALVALVSLVGIYLSRWLLSAPEEKSEVFGKEN